jgi:hypothetical protein
MESSVIHHMVDSIINNQQTDAMEKFNEIMATKITDALDAKKMELASNIGKEQGQEEHEEI